jgi:hypothetical protein
MVSNFIETKRVHGTIVDFYTRWKKLTGMNTDNLYQNKLV